jgi:hypothetical protein
LIEVFCFVLFVSKFILKEKTKKQIVSKLNLIIKFLLFLCTSDESKKQNQLQFDKTFGWKVIHYELQGLSFSFICFTLISMEACTFPDRYLKDETFFDSISTIYTLCFLNSVSQRLFRGPFMVRSNSAFGPRETFWALSLHYYGSKCQSVCLNNLWSAEQNYDPWSENFLEPLF